MSGMKVGFAASVLLVLVGGTARAQGVVPGGWDSGFGAQAFAGGGPSLQAVQGPSFAGWPDGRGAMTAAAHGPAGVAGPGRLPAAPLTADGLGGLARTIERMTFRRRGR